MNLGGIYVTVKAKTDDLKSDLGKAEKLTEKSAGKLQSSLDGINFAALGVAATAFAATVAYGMKEAIVAASDFQEIQSKFDVVFKEQTEQAEVWAKTLQDSYLMGRSESKMFLSSLQDLLKPMGIAADTAGEMSFEVIKLAGELASFNNLTTEQVVTDITAAFTGSNETMAKYGIMLNETVIAQKALEMGLAATKTELTFADKAQAKMVLMFESSTDAIGDIARNMDTYAAQTKKLDVQFRDLEVTIGEKLLPYMTTFITQLNTTIETSPELITAIGDVAEGLLKLLTILPETISWFLSFSQALGLASSGFIGWSEALTSSTEVVKNFNETGLNPEAFNKMTGLEKSLKNAIKLRTAAEERGDEVSAALHNNRAIRYQEQLSWFKKEKEEITVIAELKENLAKKEKETAKELLTETKQKTEEMFQFLKDNIDSAGYVWYDVLVAQTEGATELIEKELIKLGKTIDDNPLEISVENAGAISGISGIEQQAYELQAQVEHPYEITIIDNATDTIGMIQESLNQLQDKTIMVTVQEQTSGSSSISGSGVPLTKGMTGAGGYDEYGSFDETGAYDVVGNFPSSEHVVIDEYQKGTGLQGLPDTGLFYGHKGEIVKTPQESESERRSGYGDNYIINISPTFMTGDRSAGRSVALEIKKELEALSRRS